MSRINWTRDVLDFFIEALVEECRAGNRPYKTLNRIGKANVVRRMTDHTGEEWTWNNCKHKWEDLKKKWSCWRQLTKFSGIAFHPRTGVIDMPQEWWEKQIAANKVAKFFQHNCLEYEEQLDYIFKRQEPVNVGPNELGGHEGGDAGVPTQPLDSENSDESDDELADQLPGQTPSQPVRTASMTSASSGKRKSSDPMVTSQIFWEGFKNYYQDMCTSKKQKETDSSSKQAEEDLEYEELMTELLQAGISPTSEEYFMASVVLIDIHRRGAYRPLPTIEAKLTWIKRMYHFIIGQPPSM